MNKAVVCFMELYRHLALASVTEPKRHLTPRSKMTSNQQAI